MAPAMSENDYLMAFVAFRDSLVDIDVLRNALAEPDAGECLVDRLSRLGVDPNTRDQIVWRAQRLSSAMSFEEGSQRYTRERKFSSGGMGQILIVHDTQLERDVALKELLPEHEYPKSDSDSGPSILDRFIREAKITGQLEHPGIVPVYELGERPDGARYYTMKFVRGRSFEDVISETKTLKERLGLLTHFVDVCQALAYAHSRGVIHRDIKPSNVLVGSFGETIVIDWGLAKLKDASDSSFRQEETIVSSPVRATGSGSNPKLKTEFGQVMGTPEYMAPEQALGRLSSVDERSDVYSLGVVLYKVLTGRTPFTGATQQAILNSVVNDDPVPPRHLDPSIPRELDAICLRALEKEPEDRFQSAKDMADEIDRFLTGALVTAYEYGVTDLFRRFVRRYKVQLGAAAAAALFAIVATGIAYRNVLRANEQERVQRHRAERVQYTSNIQLAASRLDDGLDLLARQTLANTPPSERNWEWGYLVRKAFPDVNLRREETHTPRVTQGPQSRIWERPAVVTSVLRIEAHSASVMTAEFNGDATRLCTASLDNTAKVWDATNGALIREFPSSGGPMLGARLSADGKRVLTLEWNQAQISEVDTGRLLVTCVADPIPSTSRCWFSPDEREVITSHADGSVRIWDASTGSLTHVLQGHSQTVLSVGFGPDGIFATASPDGEICVWDFTSGEQMDRIETPAGSGSLVSPDFRYYLTNSSARNFRMWDRVSRTEVPWDPVELRGDLRSFSFSRDSSVFVTGDLSGDVHVFRTNDGKELAKFSGKGGAFQYVALSADATELVTTASDGSVEIWSPQDSTKRGPVEGFVGHQKDAFIIYASYSVDGSKIVSVGYDKSVFVWDADSGAILSRYSGHTVVPRFAEFVPDGKRVVSVDWAGNVHVWAMDSGASILKIEHDPDVLLRAGMVHGGAYGSLRWLGSRMNTILSPDGQRVVAHDGTAIRVHDLDDGSVVCTLENSQGWGVALPCFSPDGQFITSNAFLSNRTFVWDAATGRIVATLEGHQGPITMASFDPSSTRVLTASLDRVLRLYDAGTGRLIHQFPGHKVFVLGARFDASGHRIASFSADGTARIWDADSGAAISVLAGHTNLVDGAAFSPDGTRILTVSEDSSLRVWSADGEELVSLTNGADVAYAVWSPSGRDILSAWSDGVVRIYGAVDWERLGDVSGSEIDLAKALNSLENAPVSPSSDDSN